MNFLSNVLDRTGRAFLDQCSRIVADPDSLLHAPLIFAINAISTAGAAHPADADRSFPVVTSAQPPSSCEDSAEEELPELELIPETHLFVRLPSLFQSVAYQPRLDWAYSIYEKISETPTSQGVRGLDKTVENLETIEKFLLARDKLIVWQAVANRSGVHHGSPEFAELTSYDDYLTKAAEFGDWLDLHPEALDIRELIIRNAYLSSIPVEISKLTQLEWLDLSFNSIQRIEEFEHLPDLNLILDGNPVNS